MANNKLKYWRLTRSLKKLGRIVGRGNRTSIARTVCADPVLREAVISQLVAYMKKELKSLCSHTLSSVHRRTDLNALKSFDWKHARAELIAHAPTFHQIISGCLPTTGDEHRQNAIIGLVSAILLKARNRSMCAVQTIISLLLHEGHTSTKVRTYDSLLLL